MKRRQLLKNLGLGGVALVVTPTVLSILQSCKNEPTFETVFLNASEGKALRKMVDLIIPSDENVPGAVDVGVHNFIDLYWNDVLDDDEQQQIKLGFNAISDRLEKSTGFNLDFADEEALDQLLNTYLLASPKEVSTYEKNLDSFYKNYENDKTLSIDPDAGAYGFLSMLRELTIWAWKNTEEIGKNFFAYEPIPGKQVGCLLLSDATGGKAYILS